ncbi:MAG: hypothetical protein HY909_19700, partial [Deltaproteobacteria bacterium]|nr:hypothetical protein [Deltaproteobacteria bacterium]
MGHRVTEIAWLPRTEAEWRTFTAARSAAAKLWNKLVSMHAVVRRFQWEWPSKARWERWARGRFPGLSAQSVQQVVQDFCDTLTATTKAREERKAAGEESTQQYPWRCQHRYRDVPYTNQEA